MASGTSPSSSSYSRSRGIGAARWWFYPLCAAVGLSLLASVTLLAIAVWLNLRGYQPKRELAAEIARIRAAGEPITTDDLYENHRLPEGTFDTTPLWLAALNSVDEKQCNADGKSIPLVGDGVAEGREAEAAAEADAFLLKYDDTIRATLAAAQQPGECRFPVEFEDGFSALMPHAQEMRLLARLLLLRSRRQLDRGDVIGTLESIDAIFAASESLENQEFLVEHLVRLAIFGVAMREVERVLNLVQLSDEQLSRLQTRLQSSDLQPGLTRAMIGERATIYLAFHNLGALKESGPYGGPGDWPNAPDGNVTLPADCLMALELFKTSIEGSREPFPSARQRAFDVENRLNALAKSGSLLTKLKHSTTLLLFPAVPAAFDAFGRNLASRDALLVAIAVERHRHQHGSYPEQLADLVPGFLPAVPKDPFDGQPLRYSTSTEGRMIYSVGRDGKDDGGTQSKATGEPDIVVRLQSKQSAIP